MRIVGEYSFNNGAAVVRDKYKMLLGEVDECVRLVKAEEHKVKESKEQTMKGQMLYSPSGLNKAFARVFADYNWDKVRVLCEYSDQFYVHGYRPKTSLRRAFREMDFIKDKLGVEIQFGKYSFMVYNVAAKMTIFHKLGHIDAGIEIVPVKALAAQMSTGVSYFEQFVWDLEHRGTSHIDIPVLVLGIDK